MRELAMRILTIQIITLILAQCECILDHNSSYVTHDLARKIKKILASYPIGSTHDLASYVTPNSSQTDEMWVNTKTHDSILYVTSKVVIDAKPMKILQDIINQIMMNS